MFLFLLRFSNRGKTISLEKIRMRLLHDLESYEGEEKCLAEYRKELELLQQEKMAHVEELRQIHSDINAVSFIKVIQSLSSYEFFKLFHLYSSYYLNEISKNSDGDCNETSRRSQAKCSKFGSELVGRVSPIETRCWSHENWIAWLGETPWFTSKWQRENGINWVRISMKIFRV